MLRVPTALALVVGMSAAPAMPARALEDYAAEIAKQLDLPKKPSCHYCHAVDRDGVATDTAFSDALKTRGFSRRNGLPSLRRALARLEDDRTDSDGDGSSDVEELSATANPNDPSDLGQTAPGCSASSAHTNYGPALWIWPLVVFRLRRRVLHALDRSGAAR